MRQLVRRFKVHLMTTTDDSIELVLAAEAGNLEEVQRLIATGVAVEQSDTRKTSQLQTPLMRASASGHAEIVKALLDAGIDVEQKNGLDGAEEYQGASALIMTFVANISDKKAELMREMLLRAGADINTTNASGWTPLMYAATCANPDYLRKCLELGADATFRTQYGETAPSELRTEWLATKRFLTPDNEEDFRQRFQQVREILLNAGAQDRPEVESAALEAVAAKNDSAIAGLLKDGLDPDTANRQGTLLQQCFFLGLRRSAAALLKAGANAAQVTFGNPMPPLFSAVSLGDIELIKLVLDSGVSPLVPYGEHCILDFLPHQKDLREAIRELLVAVAPDLGVTKADLGVTSFDTNYSALLVKAAGRRVAQAIAKLLPGDAKHWHPREGIPKISGFLVLTWTDRVDPIRWATVHPLRAPKAEIYDCGFAKKLSAEVKNDVILFRNSDTAGWFGYDYFKKGKRMEQFQVFPEDLVSLDGDPVFETSLRKASLPEEGSLTQFVNSSFAEFGAYVPGFNEIHDIEDAGERLRAHFVVKVAE